MPIQWPFARPEILRHLRQRVGVDRREQAGLVDQRHRRRILGQEHVGRRGRALLDDLVGEIDVAALAERDLDAGLLGEASAQAWVRLACCAL